MCVRRGVVYWCIGDSNGWVYVSWGGGRRGHELVDDTFGKLLRERERERETLREGEMDDRF